MAASSHRVSSALGPVSRKSRELFGPEKPFVKLRPAFSVKLVFSYVVKGIQIKITAKFSASRRLRFEDTKRIMSPETRPKSFGTFEKQAPNLNSLKLITWSYSVYSRTLLDRFCEKTIKYIYEATGLRLVFQLKTQTSCSDNRF